MNPGILILVLAVVAAVGFGLYRRRTDGTFASPAASRPVVEVRGAASADGRPVVEVRGAASADGRPVVEARGASVADGRPVVEVRGAPAPSLETSGPSASAAWSSIAASVPDAELGERATLLQFSSAFCAPCRTTRVVLSDVAGQVDGVAHVEIDAEEHLELVRALDVRRTPTTLVLDRHGHEVTRAAGAPRREQVLAALPALQGS
ncbi:TlpA family protein disulfide reductase [Nocardioides daeguensis]|uniref:Thioredoxin domain-containing protein n=1 Tax=Nocardioides daeguensis TaxID=908359 RepID=A0ABP6VB60_9ACTN|nr:thioredoxin family protein [Nocardioides daeguensis]MBV6726192.1 thioredoxin family protein [Nocardioides daeguensis]MCR1772035.1 thioredoxin family protein [Nocardioides daeguensis]